MKTMWKYYLSFIVIGWTHLVVQSTFNFNSVISEIINNYDTGSKNYPNFIYNLRTESARIFEILNFQKQNLVR